MNKVATTPRSTINTGSPLRHRVNPSSLAVPIAGVVFGWLLCEGLLRILVPGPIFYSTWFTPGVHQRDPSLGFVFVPNFVGSMRHADGVWMEPLELDASGFRRPAIRPALSEGDDAETIVMLGGASMAFSFGLSDSESLHHQSAIRLPVASTIQVVSWPGFTLSQDLTKVERFLDPTTINRAVVFAYSEDDYEAIDRLSITVPPTEIPMDHDVVLPEDAAAKLLGWPYYRSVVLAGASRWWMAIAGILDIRSDAVANKVTDPSAVSPAVDNESATRQPAVLLAASRLQDIGIREILIVALPHQLRNIGPDSLEAFSRDGVAILDLRELSASDEMDWIAGGHYGPRSSQAIAARIASLLSLYSKQ